MIDIDHMSNKAVLQEQYRNADMLMMRKSLHEKYSMNKIGFQRWMFNKYPFKTNIKILELGSGRGELWKYYFEDEKLANYNMDITLSDFSDGMVEYLNQIYKDKKITIKKIDITDIPYEDATFDLIIANSMLYHIKDINRALTEVRRVLKPSGAFFCSTFGLNGMTQYLYNALDQLHILYDHKLNISFTLQNGLQQLNQFFNYVERIDYEDALEIDHVEDYLEYIYSMASLKGLDHKYYNQLLNYFNSRKTNGYLYVPKEYGIFVARKIYV